jgi:hypothetical protein
MLFGDARKKCHVDSCSFAYHVLRFSLRCLSCAIYDINIWTRCMVLSDGYHAVFHHFDDRVVCALHCTLREKMDLLWICSSLFNLHNSAAHPWTQTVILGETRRNTTWTRTRASSFNRPIFHLVRAISLRNPKSYIRSPHKLYISKSNSGFIYGKTDDGKRVQSHG